MFKLIEDFLNSFPKTKTKRYPKEEAKKRLKRALDWCYNRHEKVYCYKGYEVKEDVAINFIIKYSLKDLEDFLESQEGEDNNEW